MILMSMEPHSRHTTPRSTSSIHLLTVVIIIVSGTFALTGCTSSDSALVGAPNIFVDSSIDPFEATPPELRTTSATVLYATDRKPETLDGVYGYSATRSRAVSFGLCTVRMGNERTTWEDLVVASTTREHKTPLPLALEHIDERGTYPALRPFIQADGRWVEDPIETRELAEATTKVHALLSERLALTPRKEVFLFVHGYNNTFASGAFRAAQIWHFIGRGGVPVLYSWPAGSAGILQGYTRDRESGEFAIPHLKRFIRDLASCEDVKKINLIAHSRGTDVLGTALRELHIETRGTGKSTHDDLKLGQIVLAAPDLDLDVYIERFSTDRVGFVFDQVTVYASPDDKAIGLSTWLFGSLRRIGQVQLKDLHPDIALPVRNHPYVHVIEMRCKTDGLGHGYFLSSPACLSDLILVLRDGRMPGAKNGRPLFDDPTGFWQLKDGYPFASSVNGE
jgi:esterase/lipase superfamily enzyme